MARLSVSGEANPGGSRWPQLYLGLGFTLLSTWLLGVALAGLLRGMYAPEFAHAAMTIALCGFPAGGFFAGPVARRGGDLSAELGRLSFVNAVLVGLLLWFILTRSGAMAGWTLAVAGSAAAVPFFFAGMVAALAYGEGIGRVVRTHWAAVAGSAAGAVLAWLFFENFGLPNTVIAAGVNFGVAAAFWFNRAGDVQLRASAVLVALLLVMVMIMNGTGHFLEIRAVAPAARWEATQLTYAPWVALPVLVGVSVWRGARMPVLFAAGVASGIFAFLGAAVAPVGACVSAVAPLLLKRLERKDPAAVRTGWSWYAAGCVWGFALIPWS